MTEYTVRVGLGVRRHGQPRPASGPCSPPYLDADRFIRFVRVEADSQMEAELLAFEMADMLTIESNAHMRREDPAPGSVPSFPGRIVAAADMVTSIETVEAEL